VPEPLDKWRGSNKSSDSTCNSGNLLSMMYSNPKRWGFTFQQQVQLTMAQIHGNQCHQVNERSSYQSSGYVGNDGPGLQESLVQLMERSIFSARYCFVESLKERQVYFWV
jgi:Deoxynucleoside kinase